MEQEMPEIEQIIEILENIEKENLADDQEVKDWLEQITQPQFELVDSLISLFLDQIKDTAQTESIFKVLRKFLIYKNDIVRPQLLQSRKLPKALTEYLILNEKSHISENYFYLIQQIFSFESFKAYINEKFLTSLFEGLNLIEDDDVFRSIAIIFTDINYNLPKEKPENIFLAIHKSHDNSRILDEMLLRILNTEYDNKELIYKILQCFIDIMEYEDNCIFYSNDLITFIDIVIVKLEKTYTEQLRWYLLKALERILKFDEYYKNNYKKDELVELLESYAESEDKVDAINRGICKEILQCISDH